MELRELAERALFSPRLEDKLETPDGLTDHAPGPALAQAPPSPGRPARLRMNDPRPRARFPKPGALHAAEARGRALHFFANHELLAIELMALCLLRFPEAPASFRRGVAHTLLEEQDHLRRYRARMAALGVELGDVPVGGHFWRALAGMRRPLDYVTGMSLVFEQANLDHAARWQRLFAAAEDAETARLLGDVLADEIGHVKHGAAWFERWRPPGDPFEVFAAELPGGLDPVRARGPALEVEPRRAAGLSEGFVQALARHRAPKGRRPRLWVFDPRVEDHVAGRASSPAVEALIRDLAPTFGLLGSDDDLVWAPRPPAPEHDDALAAAGLPVPRRLRDVEAAAAHAPDAIHPWGLSPEVRARLRTVEAACRCPLSARDDHARLSKALVLGPRRAFAARGRLAPSRIGEELSSLADLDAWEDAAPKAPFVLKALFSASGRARRVVTPPLERADRRWAEGVLRGGGGLLAEPWLDRQADLSLAIAPTGGRPALLRLLTSARGGYLGHVLGPPLAGLPAEVAAAVGRFPGGVRGLVEAVHAEARAAVPDGPLGVDLLVERRPSGELALQPWVEINARYTMGHVACALGRRIAPGRVGLWLHVHRGALRAAGFSSFEDLGAALARDPMRTRAQGTGRGLDAGTLPTNDPGRAEQVLSVLVVDVTASAAAARLPAGLLPRELRL